MQLSATELRERVEPLFRENFDKFAELGASVSVWQEGREILNLYGGFKDAHHQESWEPDTLVVVWSATKAIGAACLLHGMQENGVELTEQVARFWPEFAGNGKAAVTIAEMLSHSAGLCALDRKVDILDYGSVVAALEQQAPLWPPGKAHGYHARTFGFLVDELTRRMTGLTTSEYWRRFLADPLNLDFWIGLPADLNRRVATIYAAKVGKTPEPAKFYRDVASSGTLQRRTFTSPYGLHAVSAMNEPKIRAQPLVSFGGIGSAHALGRFYAMLANRGMIDQQRFFNEKTLGWMSQVISSGQDRVFEIPTAFSAGMMLDSPETDRRIFGPSCRAFGHPGAGGSHAFADPEHGLAFAYVMNQMEQSVLPNEKALRLIEAIYAR